MACCILAAFLFGLLVRSLRKLRGLDPEPVPTIPKPVVRVDSEPGVGTGPSSESAPGPDSEPGAGTREPALTR